MDGVVGRGTLLAGRYRTLEPLDSDLPGASSWDATDQILDRPVRVTVLHSGHVPQALDAARRAALVTDARLIRVLDVGEHEGVAYTVCEQVSGPSLGELVARGPLPADQARAIVGEVASALEAARRRGVHHLTLRPSVLHLTPDDRVVVTGLAVDAALLGRRTPDAAEATRADTVGLVALLYAALTGRWPRTAAGDIPGGRPGSGLDAAPVLEGAPVPPAEVASGVPNDLDTLCAVTLGVHDDGPRTPAELVQELEPWGDIRATDLFAVTQPLSLTAPAPQRPPSPARGTPSAPARVQRTSVRSAFAGHGASAPSRPGTPPPATPARSSSWTASPVGAGAATAAGAAAAAHSTQPGSTSTAPVPVGEAAAPPAPQAPAPQPAAPQVPTPQGPAAHTPAAHTPGPQAPAPRGATPAGDGLPTGAPARASGGAVAADTAATAAIAKTPAPAAGRSPATAPGHPGSRAGGIDVAAARESIAAHRFDPTRLVLLLVGLAIVLGLYVASQSLTRPVGPPAAETPAAPVADPAPEDEPAPPEEPEPEPAPEEPEPVTPPVISSAVQLDPPPDGDENEHPEAVPLAIDGDPGTAWYTRTYSTPAFGGLKDGVGYAVTLAEPATVSTVALQVRGSGGQVEVRATDPSTPTEGEVLAAGPLGPDTTLSLAQPTETQNIVLWFTELPQTEDGSNRVELAEITLS